MPELSDLRGIGPVTAAVLAEHGLGSVSKLARAGIDALTAVPGFGAARARAVLDAAREAVGAEPAPTVPAAAGPGAEDDDVVRGAAAPVGTKAATTAKGKKAGKGKGAGKSKGAGMGKKAGKGKGAGKGKKADKGKGAGKARNTPKKAKKAPKGKKRSKKR